MESSWHRNVLDNYSITWRIMERLTVGLRIHFKLSSLIQMCYFNLYSVVVIETKIDHRTDINHIDTRIWKLFLYNITTDLLIIRYCASSTLPVVRHIFIYLFIFFLVLITKRNQCKRYCNQYRWIENENDHSLSQSNMGCTDQALL